VILGSGINTPDQQFYAGEDVVDSNPGQKTGVLTTAQIIFILQ
jgi:hypothetical protein